MGYFKKHWPERSHEMRRRTSMINYIISFRDLMHFQFKERWLLLNVAVTERSSTKLTKSKGLCTLLRELSDDEDESVHTGIAVPDDPRHPWLHDYWAYIDVLEQVPDGWTTIEWWGVSQILSQFVSVRSNLTCDSTILGAITLPGLPLHETTLQ